MLAWVANGGRRDEVVTSSFRREVGRYRGCDEEGEKLGVADLMKLRVVTPCE